MYLLEASDFSYDHAFLTKIFPKCSYPQKYATIIKHQKQLEQFIIKRFILTGIPRNLPEEIRDLPENPSLMIRLLGN